MRIELPLQVLGLLGPVLSWVEGMEGLSWPTTWIADEVNRRERERAWLIRELPTYSFDTVDAVVDLARPPGRELPYSSVDLPSAGPRPVRLEPPRRYDLKEAFDKLAQRYLVWNGGSVCVREGRMEELHELSLRFPVGHLIRHEHARAVSHGWSSEEEVRHLPEQVSLLPSNSQPLRTVVRSGLSEGHLHLMGVSSAEENWADNLLQAYSADVLEGFKPNEKRLILLSRYAGRVLALAVLYCRLGHGVVPPPFHLLPRLDALYFARNRYEDLRAREVLRASYDELLSPFFVEPQAAPKEERVPMVAGSWGADPLHAWLLHWIHPLTLQLRRSLLYGLGARLPEVRLPAERGALLERLHLEAHRQLVQLPPDSPERYFLHQVLFRYLVFRTHHWQLGTQYGKTTGLRYFKRFYDSRQRRPAGIEAAEVKAQILRRLRQWRGLRVLEGRISPPENPPAELKPWIVGYAEGASRGRLRKFGLIVHFIKAETGELEDTGTQFGYPSLRYGKIRRATRHKAFHLFRVLSSPDPWVPFIVGIDAANLELTTPPEVYGPAFRFLRELPIELRAPADRNSDAYRILPQLLALVEKRRLGMTYHVGEDFRHILSGLRAIDEVIHFLHAHPGDRLGHAIALGLDPEVWLKQTGDQAVLPKIEWLDTLVWVHHLMGPGSELVGRLGIEDLIQRLAWEVYAPGDARASHTELEGKDLSPLTLHDAWLMRQLDPYCVDTAALAHGGIEIRPNWTVGTERRRWAFVQRRAYEDLKNEIGAPNAYRLLLRYWFDRGVRQRGQELALVDMQDQRDLWLKLCRAVQHRMIEALQWRQMVVEVNPTVNRLIGPMERLQQHHIFNLTLDDDRRLSRKVRVTVNTDNPAVFNTSLAHEYYLLGETLLGEGRPEGEVVEWLEWLRRNGEEYSFVRQLPGADDPAMAELLRVIREARPTVRSVEGREAKLKEFWRHWARLSSTSAEPLDHRLLTPQLRGLEDRITELESLLGRKGEGKRDRR